MTSTPAFAQTRAPELTPNRGWLNTDRPLRLSDELKGHVVVLDFWTYCCINCIHILPDLEHLEEKYKDQPVMVVGVHSAKFDNESERRSIRSAMQRYGIEHPVVIDDDMSIWQAYGARGWPTFVIIDPEGRIIGQVSGEGKRQILDTTIARLLDEHRAKGTLAKEPFRHTPDASVPSASGLAFPGKVIADADSRRLFIADSTNNRILAATWPDDAGMSSLVAIYGGTEPGFADGDAAAARFNDPQGMAFDPRSGTLYVADRKNHAVRAIDLKAGTVSTAAGNGKQSYDRAGGQAGTKQGLSSPWDLALSPDGKSLYIAMAGPHQLWKMDVGTKVAGAIAGGDAEALRDGPAMSAHLAQPSGLALTPSGKSLYFADSETSAIRVMDLETDRIMTILGAGLFEFGDIDGSYPDARLQHPLGVAFFPTADGPRLVVADTYNHKLRLVNPVDRSITGWLGARAGEAEPGKLDLDEPAGIAYAGSGDGARVFVADTNNHRVVMINPETEAWTEVTIAGLADAAAAPINDAALAGATPATVAARPGSPLTLSLTAGLAAGFHPNPEAPLSITVRRIGEGGKGTTVAQRTLRTSTFPVSIELPPSAAADSGRLLVEVAFASCSDGDMAVCIPGEAAWLVTLQPGDDTAAALTAPAKAE